MEAPTPANTPGHDPWAFVADRWPELMTVRAAMQSDDWRSQIEGRSGNDLLNLCLPSPRMVGLDASPSFRLSLRGVSPVSIRLSWISSSTALDTLADLDGGQDMPDLYLGWPKWDDNKFDLSAIRLNYTR